MTLQHRHTPAHLLARDHEDAHEQIISGIAVPLDTPTQIIPGFYEQIARGAIDLDSRPALFYRHGEPIGVVTGLSETPAGLEMTAKISDTTLGHDAYTLARDGAIGSLSIGFFEREYTDTTTEDGDTLRTQTRIDLREISLVPIPAYEQATITNVRHIQETPMTTTATADAAALEALAATTDKALDALDRRLSLLETNPGHASDPAPETRSGGQLLRAAFGGDEQARQTLANFVGRAPATTTAADARYSEPTFIKDLTRIVDRLNPLASLFATGSLPAEGNTLEFAQLKSNTMTVAKQAKEGDALPTGTVSTETKNATISTYGGATTLSRQAIERTRANVLDLSLRAMAMAAAKTQANEFAQFFKGVVKEQAAHAITTTKPADALDWKSLLHMVLDANAAYEDNALTLDGLIVNRPTFEAIAGMTDANGRPILTPTAQPSVNGVGSMNAPALTADLYGLHVVCNRDTTLDEGAVGAFYNRDALRTYTSGIVSLQDENVLDLTKAFSIYYYAAYADEIPAGIVPLKVAA